MANNNKHIATSYQKAFAEGESIGMIDAANGEIRPTDADLEVLAVRVFARYGLTFDSNFDGRMSFIAGFWQGWRKSSTPYVRTASENAHAISEAMGG